MAGKRFLKVQSNAKKMFETKLLSFPAKKRVFRPSNVFPVSSKNEVSTRKSFLKVLSKVTNRFKMKSVEFSDQKEYSAQKLVFPQTLKTED